jgi:hypothetical protein
MSAPAAKARSEPVSTTAAMLGEAWKVRRAVLSSVMSGVQRALRALGRLRVTRSEGVSEGGLGLVLRGLGWRWKVSGFGCVLALLTLTDTRPGLRDLNELVVSAGRGREGAGDLGEGARLEAGGHGPHAAEGIGTDGCCCCVHFDVVKVQRAIHSMDLEVEDRSLLG